MRALPPQVGGPWASEGWLVGFALSGGPTVSLQQRLFPSVSVVDAQFGRGPKWNRTSDFASGDPFAQVIGGPFLFCSQN
jgi:hypothetical protein